MEPPPRQPPPHARAPRARVHGPVMTLKLGLTTAVVVSSRDAAEEAFTKHDRRLAARAIPDAARALGFSGRSMIWLPSSDPLWKSLRGIVATNVFSPRGLAAARSVRERKVRDLVGYFRGRAGREVVDFGQAVYGGALNLVSSAFCSVDVVDVGGESAQGVRELVQDLVTAIAKPNVSDLVPFLRPLDLQGWRRWTAIRFQKVFLILDGITDRRMAAANGSTEKHGDFLDSLLDLVPAGKLARGSLTTILFDVIAAGSDTVSLTVEWAMAELLRNPSVMAKARRGEGGLAAASRGADTAAPPGRRGWRGDRRLCRSTVIFNAWAIMRDPAAWERPDKFVPERFLDMADQVDFRGKAFEFIPFGSGRRLCPGLPMAERVVPFVPYGLAAARVRVAATGRRFGRGLGCEREVYHRQRAQRPAQGCASSDRLINRIC
ncbi:hypothetical protein ACQ4PT_018195 [Festuca glaucescens]